MFLLSYGNMSGSLRVLPKFLLWCYDKWLSTNQRTHKVSCLLSKITSSFNFLFQPRSKRLPISTLPSTSLPCSTLQSTTLPSPTLPRSTLPRPALPCSPLQGSTLPSTALQGSALPCSTLPRTSLPCTSLPNREEMIFFQSDFISVTWFVKGFRLQWIGLIPQV